MSGKNKKQPSDAIAPTDDKPLVGFLDAGDSSSSAGVGSEKPDTSNEQETPLGDESSEGKEEDDTAIDTSKDDESKDDEGEHVLTIGLMRLRYTGETSISLDASMVGVYRKVTIEPNQSVLLPEMLGRHWVKKPFFTKVY